MHKQFTKTATVTIKGADPRRITFVASHEKLDRDSEVIIVAGIDTSEYRKNPVMLRQHDARGGAVANVDPESLRTVVIDGAPALIGEAFFPDRPASNEALADVRAGLLNSVSIGFHVVERGAPILPGQQGPTYLRTKLLEISLVAIPACATCTITAKCAGAGCSCKDDIDLASIPYIEKDSDPFTLQLDDEAEQFLDVDVATVERMARRVVEEAVLGMISLAVRKELLWHRGRVD